MTKTKRHSKNLAADPATLEKKHAKRAETQIYLKKNIDKVNTIRAIEGWSRFTNPFSKKARKALVKRYGLLDKLHRFAVNEKRSCLQVAEQMHRYEIGKDDVNPKYVDLVKEIVKAVKEDAVGKPMLKKLNERQDEKKSGNKAEKDCVMAKDVDVESSESEVDSD